MIRQWDAAAIAHMAVAVLALVVVQEVAKEAVAVRVLGAVRIPVKALAQAVVEVDAAV